MAIAVLHDFLQDTTQDIAMQVRHLKTLSFVLVLSALIASGIIPPTAVQTVSDPTSSRGGDLTTMQDGGWQCWGPDLVDPCRNTLLSVAMVASADGWAVGGAGAILHWNGSTWTKVNSPTTEWLEAVTMSSSNDGWAVGWNGTILRWDGNAWNVVSSPTVDHLSSVAMVTATDGWIVGGVILHWNGSAWLQVSNPTGTYFNSVDMVSTSDGWAVGSNGVILHWNGSTWSQVSSPTSNSLLSVDMISATDGWAVGISGTILRWDGNAWSQVSSSATDTLNAVAMLSAADGWAVSGGGTILRWNGSVWSQVAVPAVDALYSVMMVTATDGWAVGIGGALLRWNGSAWNVVTRPITRQLNSVSMSSANDGWAVGIGGIILHWNGSVWSQVSSPTSNGLWSVATVSATEAWAVGDYGTILRWNGGAWVQVTSPTAMSLAAVTMLSATDGWIVGGYGTILRWNGSAWTEVRSPTTKSLFSVIMLSPTDGWAVGGLFTVGSSILHWNGNTWIEVNSPTTNILWSVAAVSAADAWAVGDGGTILRWNGSVWSQVNSPVTNSWHSVAMVSATNGWIVAPSGTILHWNGSAWSQVNKSTSSHLLSVTMTATDGWAVGSWGTILHYIAGCTSVPPVDLKVDMVLPVQVLEGQPLVKDKATAVKATISKTGSGSACNVSAQLTYGPSTYTRFFVDEPFNIDAQHALIADNLTYPLNFAPSEITKTIYFFSDSLAPAADPFTATVMADYIGAIVETDETNNTTPSSAVPVYDAKWGVVVPNLDITYFRTDWNRPTWEFDTFYRVNDDFLTGVYPISSQRFNSTKSWIASTTVAFQGFDGRLSQLQLNAWRLAIYPALRLAHPMTDRFMAVVPAGWFGQHTTGNLSGAVGSTNPNFPELIVVEALASSRPNGVSNGAHELGHSYGLHLSCEEYDPNCDMQPPFNPGNLAPSGLWVEKRLPIQVTANRYVYCFMGGSDLSLEYWIDTDDYSKLLTDHRTPATHDADAPSLASPAILATGIVDITGTVALENWYTLADAELTALTPGPYTFEYQDASGSILYQQSFDITYTFEGSTFSETPFGFIIPNVPGTAKIVTRNNGVALAQKVISTNAPTVTLIFPNGGERLSGQVTVQWIGSDADGDGLTYVVLISSDNGTSWEPLIGDLTTTSYDLSGLQKVL
jgi:photosystem II stability/assembly factor-like uncharacterized protein